MFHSSWVVVMMMVMTIMMIRKMVVISRSTQNSKLDGSKIQLNRCSSRKAHVFPLLVLRSARKDAGGGLKAFAGEIERRKRFRSW